MIKTCSIGIIMISGMALLCAQAEVASRASTQTASAATKRTLYKTPEELRKASKVFLTFTEGPPERGFEFIADHLGSPDEAVRNEAIRILLVNPGSHRICVIDCKPYLSDTNPPEVRLAALATTLYGYFKEPTGDAAWPTAWPDKERKFFEEQWKKVVNEVLLGPVCPPFFSEFAERATHLGVSWEWMKLSEAQEKLLLQRYVGHIASLPKDIGVEAWGNYLEVFSHPLVLKEIKDQYGIEEKPENRLRLIDLVLSLVRRNKVYPAEFKEFVVEVESDRDRLVTKSAGLKNLKRDLGDIATSSSVTTTTLPRKSDKH